MSTLTTNYSWIKPSVNDPTDQDLWGGYLNSNLDAQDTTLKTVSDQADLASPAVNSQSANYNVLDTDQNKTIIVNATSGNLTITLLASATAGSGFEVTIKKTDSTTNTITIDGNGVETIDGAATQILAFQYNSMTLISDGTNWQIKDKNTATAGIVLLATRTASASASLDFTSLITSTYDTYVFEIQDIVPTTNSVSFGLRTSTNNGVSWDSGGSDYAIGGSSNLGTLNNGASVIGTISDPSTGLSTDATRSLVGRIVFQNPLNATKWRMIKFSTAFLGTTGALVNCEGVVSRVTAADVDAIQFLTSSGTIASGIIRMYGISKT